MKTQFENQNGFTETVDHTKTVSSLLKALRSSLLDFFSIYLSSNFEQRDDNSDGAAVRLIKIRISNFQHLEDNRQRPEKASGLQEIERERQKR